MICILAGALFGFAMGILLMCAIAGSLDKELYYYEEDEDKDDE